MPAGYYLLRRGSTFSFRCRLPRDLARRVGKRELVRALRTAEPALARLLAAGLAIRLTDLWSRARDMGTAEEIERLIAEWFERACQAAYRPLGTQNFARALVSPDASPSELNRVNRQTMLADADNVQDSIIEDLNEGNYSRAAPIVRRLFADGGIVADAGSHAFGATSKRVMEALIVIEEARFRWASGDDEYLPKLTARPQESAATVATTIPQDATPASEDNSTKTEGKTLSAAISDYMAYLRSGRGGIKPKTEKQLRQVAGELSLLERVLGPTTPIEHITTRQAGQVKELLDSVPVRFNLRPDFDDLGYKDMLALAKRLKEPGLTPIRVNGYLDTMRGMFKHEHTYGRVALNPFAGIVAPTPKNRSQRRGFTAAELETMFSLPLFNGVKSLGRPFDPGACLVENWQFWTPLIAFFTGARIGEIAQLTPSDIRKEIDGTWVIDINERDGKRIKAEASKRIIPIHGELIRIGLVQLSERRSRATLGKLLPNVPEPVQGDPGHGLSKWFSGKFLHRVGLKADPGLGFHSFRHTMKTLLRDARVNEDVQHRLVGHENKHVGARYGAFNAKALDEALHLIAVPKAIARILPRYDEPSGAST